MSDHLFIVPGYSDEDFSFRPLRNLLVQRGLYKHENISSIEYASLDDQVDLHDFAAKLEDVFEDFLKHNPKCRIDVLAHSTGSLVVRSWLYLRRLRQREEMLRSNSKTNLLDVPVEHLFLFAPANFGSDLAVLGRSALNSVKVTFMKGLFRSATLKGNHDPFETGRKVLEALEPGSPAQWNLSKGDLHEETYFGEHDDSGMCCYPFIFAAGKFKPTLLGLGIKELQKDGTDSTVRVAGTSLNTRHFTLQSHPPGSSLPNASIIIDNELIEDNKRRKFSEIAFAIFSDYDHCGIINENGKYKKPKDPSQWPDWQEALGSQEWKPLEYLENAKKVTSIDEYADVCSSFGLLTTNYISQRRPDLQVGVYQQFFFKVIDDTGQAVKDFFVAFKLGHTNSLGSFQENEGLTSEFLKEFNDKSDLHYHKIDNSHAILMLDLSTVSGFIADKLSMTDIQIALVVKAKSPYNGVGFHDACFIIYDRNSDDSDNRYPSFFCPYTTTLVSIILCRKVDESVLSHGTFAAGG